MMLSVAAKNMLNDYEERDFDNVRLFSFRYEACYFRDMDVDLNKNTKNILILLCKALNCDPNIYNGKKQQLLDWLAIQ
jgi:hypothetical protein